MNLSTLTYNCKMCGQPGQAKYDSDTPQPWVNKLKALLTCDRCYDYISVRNKLRSDIYKCAMRVKTVRDRRIVDMDEVLKKCRRDLLDLTRSFAKLVCGHYKRPFLWEPEFVDQLMDLPDKAIKILKLYEENIKSRRFTA